MSIVINELRLPIEADNNEAINLALNKFIFIWPTFTSEKKDAVHISIKEIKK